MWVKFRNESANQYVFLQYDTGSTKFGLICTERHSRMSGCPVNWVTIRSQDGSGSGISVVGPIKVRLCVAFQESNNLH